MVEMIRLLSDSCLSTSLSRDDADSCWESEWEVGFSRFTSKYDQQCSAGLDRLEYALDRVAHEGSSGCFLYPPNGFIPWHTNILDAVGYRAYFTYIYPSAQSTPSSNATTGSYFQWYDYHQHTFKKVLTRHATVSVFGLESRQELWHAIHSQGDTRLSFGLRIPAQVVEHLYNMGALKAASPATSPNP